MVQPIGIDIDESRYEPIRIEQIHIQVPYPLEAVFDDLSTNFRRAWQVARLGLQQVLTGMSKEMQHSLADQAAIEQLEDGQIRSGGAIIRHLQAATVFIDE